MQLEFAKAAAGFFGAGISAGIVWLAQVTPPEAKTWLEGGAYLALVSCLGYAVKHLNAERAKLEAARESDRARWEKKWSDEHQENLAAREADRAVREKFMGAITELAKAIKTPEP
jgi:hypothetical protein